MATSLCVKLFKPMRKSMVKVENCFKNATRKGRTAAQT